MAAKARPIVIEINYNETEETDNFSLYFSPLSKNESRLIRSCPLIFCELLEVYLMCVRAFAVVMLQMHIILLVFEKSMTDYYRLGS
jgi:hypothetical protein